MFRILIIENNIKLRKQVKTILKSKLPFSNVAEASNEKETFSEIKKERPNFIILDIQLAGENGLNIAKKIKKRYPFVPIAINTNNDSPEYKTAAVQIPVDYFLSKKYNTINDLVSLAQSIYLSASENKSITYECS